MSKVLQFFVVDDVILFRTTRVHSTIEMHRIDYKTNTHHRYVCFSNMPLLGKQNRERAFFEIITQSGFVLKK